MKINRLAIACALLLGIGLFGMGTSEARAADPWGLGIRVGGATFQLGHGGGYGSTYYRGGRHRGHYQRGPGHSYRHHGRGHYDWHDTSHYDWHPGEYRRHGNHYDYVPGHWDYHQEGHWDYHRGPHHGHGRHHGYGGHHGGH